MAKVMATMARPSSQKGKERVASPNPTPSGADAGAASSTVGETREAPIPNSAYAENPSTSDIGAIIR